MQAEAPDVCVDVVVGADAAVEQALSTDYRMVLLDLDLDGIGAVAAADILRRAGAPSLLVALGELAPGEAGNQGFDHCLPPPASGAAIRALIAAMPSSSRLARDLGDDWIARECADLVAEFRAGLPGVGAALRAALAQRDSVEVKALVHALKGSAGAYGHATLTQQCARIEADFRAGRFDAASIGAATLVDDLRRAPADGDPDE